MASILRLARVADAEQISEIYRPFVQETPVSFEAVAPDATETANRIENVLAKFPWLVCEVNGIIAGYAYSSQHRVRFHYQWSIDCSVYVRNGFRKMGIATALYTALLDIVRSQGYVCAFAGITLPNDASVGFHESMGFEMLGIYKNVGFKLDKWHSVGWWQLQLQEPSIPPPTILPLNEVLGTSALSKAIQQGESHLRDENS